MAAMPFSQRIGQAVMSLIGWRVQIDRPLPDRCLIIGAHHTSGSDLLLTLLLMLAANLRFQWIAKDSAFRGLLGPPMRLLGGVPVTRGAASNFVGQVVDAFGRAERLQIAILPEGTRGRTSHWKTGFYYIALGAGVPIIMGYADYRRKVVGLGPQLEPSGDIEADFQVLAQFYQGITARYPARQGEVRLGTGEGDGVTG